MPIDTQLLPTELKYIVPLAERHGSDAPVSNFSHTLGRHVRYAETLDAGEIEKLRDLYVQIASQNHGSDIISLYRRLVSDSADMRDTSWPLYGLLVLFRQLGKLGFAPFNDGAIGPPE